MEELLLEDNPLKAKKRNPNIDVSQLSADYRMMEQNFLPYDSTRQGRKSWFVGPTSTSSSTPSATIRLDQQPLAEMSSRQDLGIESSIRAGGGSVIELDEVKNSIPTTEGSTLSVEAEKEKHSLPVPVPLPPQAEAL